MFDCCWADLVAHIRLLSCGQSYKASTLVNYDHKTAYRSKWGIALEIEKPKCRAVTRFNL